MGRPKASKKATPGDPATNAEAVDDVLELVADRVDVARRVLARTMAGWIDKSEEGNGAIVMQYRELLAQIGEPEPEDDPLTKFTTPKG